MEKALKQGKKAVIIDLGAAKVLQPGVGAFDFEAFTIAPQLAFVLKTGVADALPLGDDQLGSPLLDHGFSTYINEAAALHFLNSIPNSLIAEYVVEEGTTLRDSITQGRIKARDGYFDIPTEPGLGIQIHEDTTQYSGQQAAGPTHNLVPHLQTV